MSLTRKIALIVLSLMSLAAGIAKILQTEQEVQFFAEAGLGVMPLMGLGLIQVAGGLLSWIRRFRLPGLLLIALGFFLSVVIIAVTGEFVFAALSMLPVLASLWLSRLERSDVVGA
ncbi:hypothetical protein [Marinovum sp.]|uniref:hypothetical protein n=1 Tax=Marinovum sp. TaxID=2024839 RepID=UPI003A8F8995